MILRASSQNRRQGHLRAREDFGSGTTNNAHVVDEPGKIKPKKRLGGPW